MLESQKKLKKSLKESTKTSCTFKKPERSVELKAETVQGVTMCGPSVYYGVCCSGFDCMI